MRKWTRRAFIGTGTLVGGGFVLGVSGLALAPSRHSVVSDDGAEKGELTTWITVTPDDVVTVLVPHCEMGQGTQTALAMMAAEEMDADWTRVRISEAPALDNYATAYMARPMMPPVPAPFVRGVDYGTYRLARWFGFQPTGGSTAVRGTGVYGMTVAGAAAREMLIAAAAARFGVDPAECTAANSRIVHGASGRTARFGELAKAAAKMPVPTSPALKSPASYTIRRTARPRHDIPAKVNGSAIYGIDFTVPGMLYAAVEIAPVHGGRLLSVDAAPAEAMPGVKRVVKLEEAVAVVADSYWRARRAVLALKPVFDDAGHGNVSSETIFAAFDKALGAAPEVSRKDARVITSDYRVPFLAHATMEPMACTARVDGDRAEVWAGTQDPLNARSIAAKALKMNVENVHFTNLLLGGGFGRRLPFTFDYVDMAVRIAKAMSPTPVKMVWSRENDLQHDYYRPAGMARFAGALDANGAPLAIDRAMPAAATANRCSCPTRLPTSTRRRRTRRIPCAWARGARCSIHSTASSRSRSSTSWRMRRARIRSFRRDLLASEPRFRAVLERVATIAGWGSELHDGEGRGIALTESFGSIVGEVAHVAVAPDGTLAREARLCGCRLRRCRESRQRDGPGRRRHHLRAVGGAARRNHDR